MLLPYDISHLAVIPMLRQPDGLAAFNIFRSPAQGPFTSRDRSAFERLAPHLRCAMQFKRPEVANDDHNVVDPMAALKREA